MSTSRKHYSVGQSHNNFYSSGEADNTSSLSTVPAVFSTYTVFLHPITVTPLTMHTHEQHTLQHTHTQCLPYCHCLHWPAGLHPDSTSVHTPPAYDRPGASLLPLLLLPLLLPRPGLHSCAHPSPECSCRGYHWPTAVPARPERPPGRYGPAASAPGECAQHPRSEWNLICSLLRDERPTTQQQEQGGGGGRRDRVCEVSIPSRQGMHWMQIQESSSLWM